MSLQMKTLYSIFYLIKVAFECHRVMQMLPVFANAIYMYLGVWWLPLIRKENQLLKKSGPKNETSIE